MSTVVDDLLQDFEESGNEDEEDATENGALDGHGNGLAMDIDGVNGHHDGANGTGDNDDDEDDDEEMNGVADHDEAADAARLKAEKMSLTRVKNGLMQTLRQVLQRIEECQAQPPEARVVGNIDNHPEFHLLTQSNSLSTQIDSEIVALHKFIRDHYSVRFPELERLIANPLEYAKVVAIIGNGPMDSDSIQRLQTSTDNPIGTTLRSVLDGPSLMIVTVEATTTRGREMSADELQRVLQACEMVVALNKAKQTLTEFVQSRMNMFAPNLTALIGSLTAAQLLNNAGGLTNLALYTPACNIAAWGSKKEKNPGLSTNVGTRQQGYLYHSPLIKEIPPDLKKRAMRIVSAKLVLAARADRLSHSASASLGESFKAACLERLDKLTAPPPNRGQRALPIPADQPSRKRGGRRARKAKEATAMTDLRKSQNRMLFGKEEKEVGYGMGSETVGLGMIGQANDGRIRATQIDQRTRAKLGAKNKGWAGASSNGLASTFGGVSSGLDVGGKGLRAAGVGSTIGAKSTVAGAAGTASSLAFTPMQGLELVDPKVQAELSRKRKAEEDRWFKSGAFTQLESHSGSGHGSNKPGGDMLPPAKKLDTGVGKMPPPPIPRKQ